MLVGERDVPETDCHLQGPDWRSVIEQKMWPKLVGYLPVIVFDRIKVLHESPLVWKCLGAQGAIWAEATADGQAFVVACDPIQASSFGQRVLVDSPDVC